MTLCFIADFRSTIARSWIGYFPRLHQVHVLSTEPAPPMAGVQLHVLSSGAPGERQAAKSRWSRLWDRGSWIGRSLGEAHDQLWLPARALRLAGRAGRELQRIGPDLVHSLRLPIEGELGGLVTRGYPHVISAWGNDFTLFAERSPGHAWLTRRALATAAGFLADAEADVERARRAGLPRGVPTLVVPGAGGVDLKLFRPEGDAGGQWPAELLALASRPAATQWIVNARGFRGYVRNDTFFQSCAQVLRERPGAAVVAVGLRGWRPAEEMVRELGIGERVVLTGPLSQAALAELHRRSAVMVSPTEHDGTPNTLLEAMACGALPVCGDLPSIREWIDPGANGLLTPVDRPEPLAAAVGQALDDEELRRRARQTNPRLVARRASYAASMMRAAEFYDRVLAAGPSRALPWKVERAVTCGAGAGTAKEIV